MNILLLEGDESTSRSLTHQLTDKGYKVFVAYNENKAIDVVLDNHIDLIICDLIEPVLNGVSFLSTRGKFMSLRVPVIVLSSANSKQALKRLPIEIGFFMEKPLQFNKLLDLVGQCELDQILSGPLEEKPSLSHSNWIVQ